MNNTKSDEPSSIQNSINLSWIPDNSDMKVDLAKSISSDKKKIIEYTDNESKIPNEIVIRFISGKKLVIVYDLQKLIDIKLWLNSLINYYNGDNNDYIIDFIIDSQVISNTIGISIDEISFLGEINCIIKETNYNIMIFAECTCSHHRQELCQTWNIDYMGYECGYNCGLLIPEGLNIFSLPDNIPEKYNNIYTDIDWINFTKRISIELENWNKYKGTWNYGDEIDLKSSSSYDDYEEDFDLILTEEQKMKRYYSKLRFCRFSGNTD